MLKGELAGIGKRVAKAREETVQEYKDQFKDIDNYRDLMRDAVAEYKMAVKKADPPSTLTITTNLILGEPQILTPEDPVRFEQLDPIGTPGVAA